MEAKRIGFAAEEPVGDAAVEMGVGVEGRAEALQEAHCAEARTGRCAGTGQPQTVFDGAQKDAQRGVERCRVTVEEETQALGEGHDPLAHGDLREDVIGLGDLFVIRVAGNIVAPSQIGSVEFAAAQFGTRLVVVLGHSRCGAVMATLEQLRQPTENRSRNLQAIVNRIRPSVEPLLEHDMGDDPENLLQLAIRANIGVSTNTLRHGSLILEQLVQGDGLLIVGAEYSLETGEVDFFNVPVC